METKIKKTLKQRWSELSESKKIAIVSASTGIVVLLASCIIGTLILRRSVANTFAEIPDHMDLNKFKESKGIDYDSEYHVVMYMENQATGKDGMAMFTAKELGKNVPGDIAKQIEPIIKSALGPTVNKIVPVETVTYINL